MRAQIVTPWTVTDNANAPRLPVDHPLPAGAAWMDVTGQQSYQIPSLPDAYVVECWHVSQAWLDSVAADDRYLVLWSAADDAVPDAALTADQLAAIRAHFDTASAAQLDYYIGTQPDGRNVAEAADAVREWSKLFLRQDEMDPEDYAALVNRYPAWAVGQSYAAGELVAYADNLYEVVQAHTSQADWLPSSVPALYTHAVPQSVIPIWVQPTGAHDAYPLGALVTYQGQVWRSTIDANVWPPGTGSLWELVP